MHLGPSSRAADVLALRALALTFGIPLGTVVFVAGAVAAGIASRQQGMVVVLSMVALFVAMPGLQTMRRFRTRAVTRPRGTRVDRDSEPALAELVADECRALGVDPPAQLRISLDHEVRMTRSRGARTLVVGAPLVFAVSAPVARAAVAHAVFRDRSVLCRLLDRWAPEVLECAYSWAFVPLAGIPWRVATRAIWSRVALAARAHVLLADAHCARRLGSGAAAEHVRVQTRGDAFTAFWTGDVAPCLDAGFRPPVLAGWQRFRQEPAVAEHLSSEVAADLDPVSECDDPLPTVGARLAVIEGCAGTDAQAGGARFAPSTAVTAIEAAALRATDDVFGRMLVEIEWERVAEVVWAPRLRAEAARHRDDLAGHTVADLEHLAEHLATDDPDGVAGTALTLEGLGAALAVALVDDGWELVAEPGTGLRAVDEEHTLFVLEVPAFLSAGADDDWEGVLADAQLGGLPLAPARDVAPAEVASGAPLWPTFTAPATLSLQRTRALRRAAAGAMAIGGTLGIGLCAVMFVLAFAAPTGSAQLSFAAMALAASLALGWWLRSRARIAFSRGAVLLTSSDLRIDDRGLLHEPMVIDRSHVEVVAIDAGATRSVGGHPLRFPFGPSPWLHPSDPELAATGWLWSGPHPVSVPMIGAGDEVPNVLLVFTEPLPGPRMRRRGEGLPQQGEALTALALCVDDTGGAHDALAGWGVVRPLSEHDVRREVGQEATDQREHGAARRSGRQAWILVASGLIVPPVALAALWHVAGLWRTKRLHAAVLGVASSTVFGVGLALYAGWL
jgi:hypothetical protein